MKLAEMSEHSKMESAADLAEALRLMSGVQQKVWSSRLDTALVHVRRVLSQLLKER